MVSLLFAVGLGVDISHFYLAKTELQNAADAAALAGASALNSQEAGIIEAGNRAVKAMNNYEFNKSGINITRANVAYGVNLEGDYVDEATAITAPKNIRFVRVTTPASPVGVSFVSMVLGKQKSMSATATAGLSVPINVYCNFIPLSVLDYDIPMTPGQVYTIRAGTGSSPSPGDYQILAVAGRGGVDVGFGIGAGVDACAEEGDTYQVDTKPGITAGKVRTGINARFDDYGGSQLDPLNEPPDTNVKENISYKDYIEAQKLISLNKTPPSNIYQSPSHDGVMGRRIVLIPIVKVSEFDPGRGTVRFNRFGAFFLKTKASSGNGGDIQAEYIEDRIVVGKGGYDASGAAGDPLLAAPVLYK
jgi:Flp pilus assembly protein TadG